MSFWTERIRVILQELPRPARVLLVVVWGVLTAVVIFVLLAGHSNSTLRGIVWIGALQLGWVLQFAPGKGRHEARWDAATEYPERPPTPEPPKQPAQPPPAQARGRSRRRRGATLASVLVAAGLVAMSLGMLVSAAVQGMRAERFQGRRAAALAACQEQMELVRARGYAALPGQGEQPLALSPQSGSPLQGMLRVEPGPVAGARQITLTVGWGAEEDLPAGQVELTALLTERGVSG